MTEARGCSGCGGAMALGSEGQDYCPACLIRLGLQSEGNAGPESTMTLSEMPEGVPERIGPYRILEVLGEGSMGTVSTLRSRL